MLINFFLKSAPLDYQRTILKDFAQSIGGNCIKSESYEECDVAVIFGSWKKHLKRSGK